MSSGKRVTVDAAGSGGPRLGSTSGTIRRGPKKEALPRRAIRSIIGFTVLGLAMLFLTYVALATTVFVFMRADSHTVAVLRNTFPVGAAPSGALVYASSAEADQTAMGKVDQAIFGVPAGSVVKIVAGPAVSISTDKDGFITVNKETTEYKGLVDNQDLGREYVAICVSGACSEGKAVIIEQKNIIGEVRGYLGLTGVKTPDLPTAP